MCFDIVIDKMRQLRGGTLRFLKASLVILFILLLALYVIGALKKKVTPLYATGVVEQQIGELQYDFSTGIFSYTRNRKDYLQGTVSETLRSTFTVPCKSDQNTQNSMCLHWIRYTKLEVTKKNNCHSVKWTPNSRDFVPHDCFSMRGAHWYGGSELYNQKWPLETADLPAQPYLPSDVLFRSEFDNPEDKRSFGNVLDRFWINSNGVSIMINSNVPLYVSVNESRSNLLCFSAEYNNSPYPNPEGHIPTLEYTVCKEDNVKSIFEYMQKKYVKRLAGLPDENLIKGLVWSTSGKYRELNLKQALLLPSIMNITKKMKVYKFEPNILEIDDPYSTAHGDFDFSVSQFKNSHQMLSMFRENGLTITVSMTPFINMDSKWFTPESDFLIQDGKGHSPSLVRWYYGLGGVVDVTNPEGIKWYTEKLKDMAKDYGIHSFNFYGCEANFLPKDHKTHKTFVNPGEFVTNYVTNMKEQFGNMIQTSCGYQTQHLPIYTSLSKRESHWDRNNGLQSIIPSVLTMGVLGYPFIVPDIIGGASYGYNISLPVAKPEKELFIRWMQLVTFLPVMKFSHTPWDYDHQVVTIFESLMKVRKDKVIPLLLRGIREAEMTGKPVIRPIWWLSPKDEFALVMDTEFLIGDSLLVAPVLEEGARQRDIYLPDGDWHDEINNVKENGQQWLRGYKVELDQIALFSTSTDFGN